MKEVRFNVKEFKRMNDPVEKDTDKIRYICYADVSTIPEELGNWMDTNPRNQNMRTSVAEAIEGSLLHPTASFHELNRGILMSVNTCKFDNKLGTVDITMDNTNIHGNIDGGHTLKIILKNRNDERAHGKYVFMEFITGLENTIDLAEARNTSVQVDLKSLEALRGTFDDLTKILEQETYSKRIMTRQNQFKPNERPIDIREILAIINMFNKDLYTVNHPIQSYTGKEVSLKKFLNLGNEKRAEFIHKMRFVIPDILLLWDTIECDLPKKAAYSKRKYGRKKYSKFDGGEPVGLSLFMSHEIKYIVPKGIIYPVLGAFRQLVYLDESTNTYQWKQNPVSVWGKIGKDLANIVLDFSEILGDFPMNMGKSQQLWDALFKEILLYIFQNQ